MDGRSLKIAVLSKATAGGGGASRVAEELAGLLRDAGHRADHWVAWHSGPPRPHLFQLYGGRTRGVVRRMHRATAALGLPELLPLEYFLFARQSRLDYDLIHVHDITWAISPFSVRLLARRLPLAWTFHDCSPFTGGCIQPMGCEAFRSRCGHCPQLGTWPLLGRFDGTGIMQDIKRRTAAEGRFQPVTPSRWMRAMALDSGFPFAEPVVIANSVDTGRFRPGDRAGLRRDLGLPLDRPVALVSASVLGDRWKGVVRGLSALRRLEGRAPFVLAVGRVDQAAAQALEGLEHHAAGYLKDPEAVARHYAAADFLLYPSLADNMPLTVMEAMSCGLPVAGFATGGIPEIVEQGVSGLLVQSGDEEALAGAVRRLLDDPACAGFGAAARARAEALFSRRRFLDGHLALYRRMLGLEAAA